MTCKHCGKPTDGKLYCNLECLEANYQYGTPGTMGPWCSVCDGHGLNCERCQGTGKETLDTGRPNR